MLGYKPTDLIQPKVIGTIVGLVVLVMLGTMLTGRPLREAGPFDPPSQRPLAEPFELPAPAGYTILATDEYELEAMVMSRCRYWFDESNHLSPVDLLLAWGPLTVEPNLSGIQWMQDMRWGTFQYRFDDVDIPQRQMEICSANTHIVQPPDDRAVRRAILRIRKGQIVRLSGYLVQIQGPGGFHWNSSRSRTDTGAGACELFYVTHLEAY